jgi:hypothetical protein
VTDAYGQPIAGATVTAVSTLGSFAATTNKRGIYALTGIPRPSAVTIYSDSAIMTAETQY